MPRTQHNLGISSLDARYLKLDQSSAQTITASPVLNWLTASKVVFTTSDKKLTSTGIGTSSQFIKGDGSLDSSTYLTSYTETDPVAMAYLDQAVKTTSSPYFVNLGIGVTPTSPLHIKALATDATLINIDGSTVDYTGTAVNYGINLNRDVSTATGTSIFDSYGFNNVLNHSHAISGTGNGGISNYGVSNTVNASAAHSVAPTVIGGENNYGFKNAVNRSGTLTSGSNFSVFNYGITNYVDDAINYNPGSALNLTVTNYGEYISVTQAGTLTSGTWTKTNTGYYSYVTGTTTGTTVNYGFSAYITGADTNYAYYVETLSGAATWGFYNNTAAHNLLGKDNSKTYFGTGADAYFLYNGSDLICMPDYVGTGRLVIDTGTAIGREALMIKQDDADQAFINYQGTSGANLSNNISTFTTEGGTVGYIKIEINGIAYWFRACTAPTA